MSNGADNVNEFSKILSSLDFRNKILFNKDLKEKLGTNFYKIGIF